MGALQFDRFGGQIPLLDDRLLPMENSAYSENAFLQAGALEPLAADVEIMYLKASTRYAFRVPMESVGIEKLQDKTANRWLEFEDADTTVVRSPVASLADGGRFYWANGTDPPGYTSKQRVIDDAPTLRLGVPPPTEAPGVVPYDLVTEPLVTRSYCYTWVTELNEESQPSPPSELKTSTAEALWQIVVKPPENPLPGVLYAKTRIYRTESAQDAQGNAVAAFFYVDEMEITQLSYSDTMASDVVASGGQLISIDWSPPPADLQGMVSMPNGMIVGWRENELWFCEPYRPHAWPVKYTINVDAPIVGLGTIDQNCMVLTSGQPWVATGIHPEVMAMRKVQPLEPCTSQGSIVNTPNGVLYASNNGLILIGPAGGRNITFDIIRKDDWPKLLKLNRIHAAYFMNGYYAYSGATDAAFQPSAFQNSAFQTQPNLDLALRGVHINLGDERLGLMTLTNTSATHNVMTDVWTGEVLVLRDRRVFHVDRRTYEPRQSYIWRSKVVQVPYMSNFAAAKIFFSLPNGADPLVELVPTIFRYYTNSKLRYTRAVRKSGARFRLPSGFKADTVQFELEGQMTISSLEVATSERELRQVGAG